MSLEQFKQRYPVDREELRRSIENFRSVDDQGRSWVALLAKALVQDASYGLRELMKPFSGSEITFRPNQEVLRDFPAEVQEKFIENHAAIIFGLSIIALEETLVTGEFDVHVFAERYNLAIAGTLTEPVSSMNKAVLRLPNEHMRLMYACVNKDRTFCGFFEKEGVNALPPALAKVLVETKALDFIQRQILPHFRDRAKILVAE